ncbi:hypothetical protein AKJ16_DCAP17872 [Drosera capensis]
MNDVVLSRVTANPNMESRIKHPNLVFQIETKSAAEISTLHPRWLPTSTLMAEAPRFPSEISLTQGSHFDLLDIHETIKFKLRLCTDIDRRHSPPSLVLGGQSPPRDTYRRTMFNAQPKIKTSIEHHLDQTQTRHIEPHEPCPLKKSMMKSKDTMPFTKKGSQVLQEHVNALTMCTPHPPLAIMGSTQDGTVSHCMMKSVEINQGGVKKHPLAVGILFSSPNISFHSAVVACESGSIFIFPFSYPRV